ncbi:MAG TPA: winged helix-turn-helix domain-containing protein [Nitrososphaerales archaeon]|nr:winged helix-turn-helix domain-containing protein [Nitrososphaerales archaeon]
MSTGEQSRASRPDLYVVARIIKSLKEQNKMNRTALATSTGLAYDKLVKYLDWMQEKQFVRIEGDGGFVVLTERGLETYDGLVKWIMEYVGRLRFPKLGSGA